MRWYPESDRTIPDILPIWLESGLGPVLGLGPGLGPGLGLGSGGRRTGVAEVPSSNCFCISPGPKRPRSPPFLNEPQSLRSVEYLEKTCSVVVGSV